MGWGYEDNEYSSRFNYVRVPQNLGHITHPTHINNNVLNTQLNERLSKTNKTRDSKLDGYAQTTFNIVSEEIIMDDVKLIKVNNISVCDGFAYKDILDKQYSLV